MRNENGILYEVTQDGALAYCPCGKVVPVRHDVYSLCECGRRYQLTLINSQPKKTSQEWQGA